MLAEVLAGSKVPGTVLAIERTNVAGKRKQKLL